MTTFPDAMVDRMARVFFLAYHGNDQYSRYHWDAGGDQHVNRERWLAKARTALAEVLPDGWTDVDALKAQLADVEDDRDRGWASYRDQLEATRQLDDLRMREIRDIKVREFRKAVDLLRTGQVLEVVARREECSCGHHLVMHPSKSGCVHGMTWKSGPTCPCRHYDLVYVTRDPLGEAQRILSVAAQYLESSQEPTETSHAQHS